MAAAAAGVPLGVGNLKSVIELRISCRYAIMCVLFFLVLSNRVAVVRFHAFNLPMHYLMYHSPHKSIRNPWADVR